MEKNISSPARDLEFLSNREISNQITNLKHRLSDSLMILGHHYQRDEVIKFSDKRGDSFGLSKIAAQSSARYIVFCGVHFMAETADIVTDEDQKVFIPDVTAGCFLADCADIKDVKSVWAELNRITSDIIPISYINSSVELKEFCSRNEGTICTSSIADKAMEWAFERGEKIFFLPDQNLGKNTAHLKMGIPQDQIVLWDISKKQGGLTEKEIKKAKVILWNGFCDVHAKFSFQTADELRQKYPDIKLIAHPECSFELCSKVDQMGSTAQIIQALDNSPANQKWGIATEKRLVNRLQKEYQNLDIYFIDDYQPVCKTMSQITNVHLLHQLQELAEEREVNQIIVPEDKQKYAGLAINRMLKLK
ncbi:MAG: quinolinate synthase NadA [Candidatus Marinimicrobia bacterium]|nr:quinolinate synthase NadA [Candidatus Neomarinimicrobiota bacterium]